MMKWDLKVLKTFRTLLFWTKLFLTTADIFVINVCESFLMCLCDVPEINVPGPLNGKIISGIESSAFRGRIYISFTIPRQFTTTPARNRSMRYLKNPIYPSLSLPFKTLKDKTSNTYDEKHSVLQIFSIQFNSIGSVDSLESYDKYKTKIVK